MLCVSEHRPDLESPGCNLSWTILRNVFASGVKNSKKIGYILVFASAPPRRSSRSFARSVIHPRPLHKDFVKCSLYSPPVIVICIVTPAKYRAACHSGNSAAWNPQLVSRVEKPPSYTFDRKLFSNDYPIL